MTGRTGAFDSRVRDPQGRVGAQGIAKGQMTADICAPLHESMSMNQPFSALRIRSAARAPPRKSRRGHPFVAHGLDICTCGGGVAFEYGDQVKNGFGGQAGDGCRSDMMDGDIPPDTGLQALCLPRCQCRPDVVIGDRTAHNRPRRSVSRAKNPAASRSPMNRALGARSVTPHQSATVMPRVSSDCVSISTFTRRPVNRSGRIR